MSEPRVLPKVRGSDRIRVTPVRRTTITPDAWGFSSVPGVLSDFQRHTSHSVGPSTPKQDMLGSIPWSDRIVSLLSFMALPTALNAFGQATNESWQSAGLVAGLAIIMAVYYTEIPLYNLFAGMIGLVGSSALALRTGGVGVPLISALTMITLPPARKWPLWEWVWLATVISTCAYLLKSWFSILLLSAILWSQVGNSALNISNSRANGRSKRESIAGYSVGVVLLALTFIFAPSSYTMLALLTSFVAVGSLAVFFLIGDAVIPSKYDCFASGVLSTLVEVAIRSRLDYLQAFELLVLIPSIFGGEYNTDLDGNSINQSFANTKRKKSMSWTVLDSILAHDDTRSIFYFFMLNFSFMLVQLLYSVLSHSLGLLSDSIHMFFDCLALLVGLLASILAKFPPSSRFPFGLAMCETVSGFANGCLLLAISVGVLFEAIERVANPVELEKITELMVISVLGLLVNLVGIFAFNHGHSHGGDGGHSHGHSHDHSHDHSHAHSHSHSNDTHQGKDEDCKPRDEASSENLHGIFLHILADTMGSVGVIISTILLTWTGWAGWDAIASIIISVLIFISAVPFVKSSAKSLLLGLKDKDEYKLRGLLSEIYKLDGLASFTVPKFWDDGRGIRGTIHVQYKNNTNPGNLRDKVNKILVEGGIEQAVIQMEEEGANCWCNKQRSG